jgi:hypothetical protein
MIASTAQRATVTLPRHLRGNDLVDRPSMLMDECRATVYRLRLAFAPYLDDMQFNKNILPLIKAF